MRPTLPRSNRRKTLAGSGSATRLAKGGRSSAPAQGGPVAPTAEYVSRRTRRAKAGSRASGSVFPRRRPHVAVHRGVFALLVFLSLALLTVSYKGGAVLHGGQLGALQVFQPIERGLSRAWDPIANGWNWTGRLFSATSEVPKLRKENEQLREQVRTMDDMEREYARMNEELGFLDRGEYPDKRFDRVAARVTARTPGAVERNLVIDHGSSDGIGVNDSVLGSGGLLGRVIEVHDSYAVIGLIINDAQSVTAAVSGSEAWGVLQAVSTEGTPVLQLRFVQQSSEVEEGDDVFTSGFASKSGELRSLYPRGIAIGSVTSVGNEASETFKTVQVTPYADFDRIDRVYVLAGSGGGDA